MEIRFYLRMIQRSWWLVLISTLVAVNFSLVYSYFVTTPKYEAVARFIVSPNFQNIESRDLINSLEALDKRSIISTYAEVLNSPQIFDNTLVLLSQDPAKFSAYQTSVTVLPEANIILFSVRGPNPETTALLVNSVGQYAIDYVQSLYVIYNIDFLDKAVIPSDPIEPRPLQDAGLALLFGGIIGVGLAIFRDQLSNTMERLKQRQVFDEESQAFIRTYFNQCVREEIAKKSDAIITLAIIRLTGIQEFYDSLPQFYINQIMRRVTETLRHQLRGNDIVGRWSKLEFGVLLPDTDGVAALSRLERISQILDQPFSIDTGLELFLDVHIGFADRKWEESAGVLVEYAESALENSMETNQKINIYKVRPFG